MEKYNILYYNWWEVTYEDAVASLKKMGHQVFVDNTRFQAYDNDQKFIETITKKIKDNNIDLIFTFNFFPDLSRVAESLNKKYVCWVYDSPHRVLDSVTCNNNCNYIFLFDYMLYEKYRADGVDTVYYMPLACNVERVQDMLQKKFRENGFAYQHDITFLGSMKNDEFDFYSQIKYMSPYIKGYVDAVMEAQIPIFGMDMVSYLMRDDICQEIFKTVKIEMGPNYKVNNKEILIDMIMKRITVYERSRILTVLGEKYNVDHYCDKKAENIPVNYKGYAAYATDMPEIFATSKINLNITLRSIQSGIPLRVIDILGAGGFCISNYQAELANYFENNKSIVWYESYEELFEKTDYYLKHDKEREDIALRGHEIVKNDFSYEKLLTKIFEVI